MFNNLFATSSFFGLFLASRAFAGVYVTNPVAETTLSSGQTLTINWGESVVYQHLYETSSPKKKLTACGSFDFGATEFPFLI
jgi:hypothetical protein